MFDSAASLRLGKLGVGVVDRVNKGIRRALRSSPDGLRDATLHLVDSGGKRLRPLLVVVSARACGGKDAPGVETLALAAEMLHSATLLHDDVVDRAAVRRGRASVPAAYGNSLAVLAGDNLFARSFDLVLRSPVSRAPQALVTTLRQMVEAEARQLAIRKQPRLIDPGTCLAISRGKTASLFRWCAQVGAMAAGATPAREQAMASFGESIGMAFQLVDDLLDMTSDQGVGEDLAQGALTLPMIYACEADRSLGPRLVAAMKRISKSRNGAHVDHALARSILATNARDRVYTQARRYTARAVNRLSALPASKYRDILAGVAEALIDRSA